MAKLSFFKNYPIKELKQDGITKNIVDLSRYVRSSNDLLLKKYEYYDYNIPHKVNRNNKQHFWRLFTCMFGVCEFNLFDETIELSRENKKQLLVRPLVNINYFNISGKSVVHVKSGMPIK